MDWPSAYATMLLSLIHIYVGSGIGGMETFVTQTEKLLTNGPKRISPHFIPMMISNMAAGDIAIKYLSLIHIFNCQKPHVLQ